LDTRPYRLELPAPLRWVEVDFSDVVDLKESELAGEKARCPLERVPLDLSDSQQRRKFLSEVADRSNNILALTEGVIPYLSSEEVAALAQDLRSRYSFRYWIADYFSPAAHRYRERKKMTRVMQNAPFCFKPEDYFGFFCQQGWQAKTIRYIPEEAHKLNRPIPLPWPMRQWWRIIRLIAPAEKLKAMGKFMGYVLFEPVPR